MIYAIESTNGLVRIAAGWPTLASSYWDATSWKTNPGAQRALRRAVSVSTAAVVATQGVAARAALDLLNGACVVVLDADAHARHSVAQAARGRVDVRRRQLLAGITAVVDTARLVGAGATIDGTAWTPEMCAARIEREIDYVLYECLRDPEVGEGWLTEAGLRWFVANLQAK
jgi:hypothetical protein